MGQFSIAHLLILTVILLIIFGPSRLPALGQSLGKAIKGFKDGLNEIDAESKDVSKSASEPTQLKSTPSEAVATAQTENKKTETKN